MRSKIDRYKKCLAGKAGYLLIFLVVSSLAPVLFGPEVLAAETAGLKIDSSSECFLDLAVSLPDVKLVETEYPDRNIYSVLSIPGAGRVKTAEPDLPVLTSWILVPNGTVPVISVEPGKAEVYENVAIPPVQPPSPDIHGAPEPGFARDETVFSADADYPGIFAEIEPVKKMRGQECTILRVYPYQFNPARRELTVFENLRVTVNFLGGAEPIPANLQNTAFDRIFESMAINAGEVLDAERRIRKTRPDPELIDGGCELLIIAHDDFENAALDLADWKNSTGTAAFVATTSETGGTNAEIEDYIDNAYASWNPAPAYLLLLGDAEFIPPWYQTPHPYTFFPYQGDVGTDIFYADIENDRVADISYGRLPVDTPVEADSAVARIIRYEKFCLLPHFFNTVALACYFQDKQIPAGYADRRFAKTSEDIRNFLVGRNYDVDRVYFTESGVTPTNWSNNSSFVFENDTPGAAIPAEIRKPHFQWDADVSDVSDAVNSGRFLLVHRDHGDRDGWGEPAFENADVDALRNFEERPVVWTINCMTGWFDNETDDTICDTGSGEECFTEHWLRHSTGGSVGLIASTRISYSGYNDRLVWGFMDAIWPGFIKGYGGSYGGGASVRAMGDVVNYGKLYLMTMYPDGSVRDVELEEFQWFGDPSMRILGGTIPDALCLHDIRVPIGEKKLYQASDWITAPCDDTYFIVEGDGVDGGSVVFESRTITLEPGFNAEPGSKVRAVAIP